MFDMFGSDIIAMSADGNNGYPGAVKLSLISVNVLTENHIILHVCTTIQGR